MVADARRAIRELDPDLAIAHVATLDDVMAESVAQPRFYMMLLTAFAVVAILLAAIGIYGVIAYLVGQRAREIGIRIALGASPSRVVNLVVREGAAMVAVGIVVGVVGAIALTQLMRALLVRHEGDRSGDVHSRDARARGRGARRLVGAGAARGERRSRARDANGLIGRAPYTY